MNKDIKIPYEYYHWGPFLFRAKVTPAECKMLIKEGKQCRNKSHDHRAKLAGHLSEEYRLTDTDGIAKWFQKYLIAYIDSYTNWRGKKFKPLINLHADTFWINYMKCHDFNPPHDHGGDLSFVIYPHMPNKIIKENKKFKGTTTGPGGIAWFYGESHGQYVDTVNMMPQTGDLFIFPSSLKHWVFPFRSNVERISVSGNILFGQNHLVEDKSGSDV